MTTLHHSAPRRIMSHLPKRSVKLPPYPSTEDQLWFAAFCLGRDGIKADPPRGLSFGEETAWLDGFGWGLVQRDSDLEEAYHDELDRIEAEGGVL